MNARTNMFLFIKKIISKFIQNKNWYLPNFGSIINKRIILSKSAPVCEQYTIVSGSGKLFIGTKCVFGFKLGGRHRNGSVEIQPRYKNARIIIGDNVLTNNNVFICAANYIEIGQNTLIGEGVTIMDHEAHGTQPNFRKEIGEIGEVKIGNNVSIGNNVMILKNTFIGANTIVASGAVVTGTFPANVIIGGIPAKVLKDL